MPKPCRFIMTLK